MSGKTSGKAIQRPISFRLTSNADRAVILLPFGPDCSGRPGTRSQANPSGRLPEHQHLGAVRYF